MMTLTEACAELREELDCLKNPGMLGSPTEVVLQAKADIIGYKKEIASLRSRLAKAWNLVGRKA